MGNFASPDMPGHFVVYRQGAVASEDELSSLGTPADLNATVLEGNPSLDGRIDYAAGSELAGSGSELLLEIDGPSVQESFFAVHAP